MKTSLICIKLDQKIMKIVQEKILLYRKSKIIIIWKFLRRTYFVIKACLIDVLTVPNIQTDR